MAQLHLEQVELIFQRVVVVVEGWALLVTILLFHICLDDNDEIMSPNSIVKSKDEPFWAVVTEKKLAEKERTPKDGPHS